MRYIQLTQGKKAIVDDEDFNFLNQWMWHFSSGYARSNKKIYMHRLIMNPPKKLEIDHINANPLDNRKQNLRIVNRSQNNMNQRIQKRKKTSQFKGVIWHKEKNCWLAYIKFNSKQIRLGYFKSEIEAANAYNIKAKILFGDFARVNSYKLNVL